MRKYDNAHPNESPLMDRHNPVGSRELKLDDRTAAHWIELSQTLHERAIETGHGGTTYLTEKEITQLFFSREDIDSVVFKGGSMAHFFSQNGKDYLRKPEYGMLRDLEKQVTLTTVDTKGKGRLVLAALRIYPPSQVNTSDLRSIQRSKTSDSLFLS